MGIEEVGVEQVGDAVTALGRRAWDELGGNASLALEEAAVRAVEGLLLGFPLPRCVRLVREAGAGEGMVAELTRLHDELEAARAESPLAAQGL